MLPKKALSSAIFDPHIFFCFVGEQHIKQTMAWKGGLGLLNAYNSTATVTLDWQPHTLRSVKACPAMGAIHKMAATLGDSPAARSLRGNFSSQRSLPHLAKHFSLGFLFLLRAQKPHTNENLSGSTPLLVTMLIFAFTGLRYRIKVWENSWDLRLSATCDGRSESSLTQFGKTELILISTHGVALTIARVPVCLQPPGRLPFRQVWLSEAWTSAAVSELLPLHTTHVPYASQPDLADARWP